ncbi:secretin N-terminal domain-containing protein [Rhodoferax sp.]|uniref:secretin N-terminal domain-containing protein n=1 Tax=Rhodoferax sp. TaxID=50421 RepID=UPI00276268D8|nr:secretin N-terminal domain-containing protein [Rhodoferax sp.]
MTHTTQRRSHARQPSVHATLPGAPVPARAVWSLAVCALALAGCAADRPLRTPAVDAAVRAELAPAAPAAPGKPVTVPASISAALAEPVPAPVLAAAEPRLDLLVNNALARDVFLAIVADTRYSMLMHPDVAGTLSVTLRGVTVQEALEAIRDVYGYDFKLDGRRITVYAPTLQTRIFTINYPHSQRVGSSELRVASGAAQANNSGTSSTGTTGTTASGATTGGSGNNLQQADSSRLSTTSRTDFWAELSAAVRGLVGGGAGRNVIASPQAGIMAVRAMPDELREVEKFLKAAQVAVERQVMLEAKIVEVELRDGFQSGIDWSALRNTAKSTGAVGVLGGNTTSNTLVSGVKPNLPGFVAGLVPVLADGVSIPPAGAGLFGLAFATDGFQAVLGFLETRGDVQILSSPRIATLNNQKAVLKVGTDEFFVTGVTGGTTGVANTGSGTTTTLPTIALTSFFSGISLDVTPQIDEGNNINLHIHPSVTTVTEKTKQIDLGSIGNYRFPMASSSVNETDTMVRIQDGNIVAIGGLMQLQSNRTASGLPGSTDIPFLSSILGNRVNSGRKKELVVLIKPTIIRTAQDWEAQTRRTRAALDDMDASRHRVIQLDGSTSDLRSKAAPQ